MNKEELLTIPKGKEGYTGGDFEYECRIFTDYVNH
jgi:hypothetical protein